MGIVLAFLSLMFLCAPASAEQNDHVFIDSQEEMNSAQLVDLKAELPICHERNKTRLVYVIEKKQFHSCNGKKWVIAKLKNGSGGVSRTRASRL